MRHRSHLVSIKGCDGIMFHIHKEFLLLTLNGVEAIYSKDHMKGRKKTSLHRSSKTWSSVLTCFGKDVDCWIVQTGFLYDQTDDNLLFQFLLLVNFTL